MRYLLSILSVCLLSACVQMFPESSQTETVITESANRVGESKYIWIEKHILVTVLNAKGTTSRKRTTLVFACVADTGKCVPVDLPCGLSGEWCEVMRQVEKPSKDKAPTSSPTGTRSAPIDAGPTTAKSEKGIIVPATGEATRKAIKTCFAYYPNGPKEAPVRVRLRVTPAGQVEDVQILTEEFADSPTGSCLTRAFKLLAYTPTDGAHTEPVEYQP